MAVPLVSMYMELKYTELRLCVLFYMHMELKYTEQITRLYWGNEIKEDETDSTCATRVIHLILLNMCQCGTGGEERKCVQIFHLVTWRKGLGTPRGRREDDIKMDLKEIGCERVDLISLADMDKP